EGAASLGVERRVRYVWAVLKALAVPAAVDETRNMGLVEALCDAVGGPAVGDAMENVYVERSNQWVGWPIPRWIERFRPDPIKSLRLEDVGDEIKGIANGAVSAQAAEVTNAVQALAEGLSATMHPVWRRSEE